MKKSIWLVAIAALVLSAGNTWAQSKAGDWEFMINGGGIADEEFDDSAFSLNPQLGYSLTDELSVAVRQNISFSDVNEDGDWRGSTRGALDYEFDLGAFQPFVGANVGYIYGDDTDDTFAAGPEVGIKWYVKEKTFISAMAEYQFFFDDVRDAENDVDEGQFVFSVGVGFNF